jgi:Zn-dependent protease
MEVPILILVLLFSVIVHECAHGLTAEHFGDPTARLMGRLTMNPLPHIDPIGTIAVPLVLTLMGFSPFGWARPVPVNGGNLRDPARQYPFIAAAGPASNLLLATLAAVLLGLLVAAAGTPPRLGSGQTVLDGLHAFLFLLLQFGIQINVLLALFNLIPIPPLDGSWILMRFLRGRALIAYHNLRGYGFLLLLVLLWSGLGRALFMIVQRVSDVFLELANLIIVLVR